MEALIKRAEGFYYNEEILEYLYEEKKNSAPEKNENEKNQKKSVSESNKIKNDDIYSSCIEEEKGVFEVTNENKQNLVLVKKKVTTHYIPPDMSALKILVESFGEEIKDKNEVLEGMSDDELLKMRSEILRSLYDN